MATLTERFRETGDNYRTMRQAARASLFWALLNRQRKWLKWLFAAIFFQFLTVFIVTNLSRSMIDRESSIRPPLCGRSSCVSPPGQPWPCAPSSRHSRSRSG